MYTTNMCLFILLVILALANSAKLPDYIIPCSRSKPEFQKCSLENGRKAIPYILKGDRALQVPVLTPLKISSISLESTNSLKITIKDATISGFDTIQLKDINIDFANNIMVIKLYSDYFTVIAEYNIDGRLLVPINGHGPCNITSVNVDVEYKLDFEIIKKDGVGYMELKKDTLSVASAKTYYDLQNLFGNKQLSDETNKILNENSKEVGKELNGPVTQTIRTIVTQLIKNYLTQFPLNKVFLP